MAEARENSKVSVELEKGNNISIVNLFNFLLEEAYESRASDIHIDPNDKDIRVRLRVDGVLEDLYN